MTTGEVVAWIAGDKHGLVWPDGLALVDGRLELSVAEQLWSTMSAGSDLAGFLDGLSAACGGLLAIPDFAIGLRVSGGVHFAVRGGFRVRAESGAGAPIEISGGEAVTWSERLVVGPVTFVLSGAADADGVARRVVSGVVPASTLTSGAIAQSEPARPDGAPADPEESGVRAAEVAPPGTETPADAPSAAGPVEDFSAGPDQAPPAVPEDIGVTRVPEPEIITLVPSHLDEAGPDPGDKGGAFSDLWDATVARSVEDAAVRHPDDERATRAAGHGPSTGTPVPPVSGAVATPVGGSAEAPKASASSPDDAAWWRNANGLITGVPRGLGPGPGRPSAGWADGLDRMHRGDHDGETIGRLGDSGPFPNGIHLQSGARAAFGNPGEAGLSTAADVPAVYCTLAHPNPPQSTACRVCREAIAPGLRQRIAQPVVGRVRASTGAACELIGVVVVGRKPSGARVRGAGMPQFLVIPGYPHVSGSHLEIRVNGWTVFARDLGSLNGTFLRRRGEQPSKLTEPITIYNGDVLDLGHGASVAFEELP